MSDQVLALLKRLGPWAKVAGYVVAIAAALGLLWAAFSPTLRAWVTKEASAATKPLEARMDERDRADAAFRAEVRQGLQAMREDNRETRLDVRESARLLKRLTGLQSERLDQPLPPLAPLPLVKDPTP